jgi:hypothetical protein
MEAKYLNARAQFFAAVRALSASPESIQMRLAEASDSILAVRIDEFADDVELKIKFARILDLLAPDHDEIKIVALETAAHMTDAEAIELAALICDFFYELV